MTFTGYLNSQNWWNLIKLKIIISQKIWLIFIVRSHHRFSGICNSYLIESEISFFVHKIFSNTFFYNKVCVVCWSLVMPICRRLSLSSLSLFEFTTLCHFSSIHIFLNVSRIRVHISNFDLPLHPYHIIELNCSMIRSSISRAV